MRRILLAAALFFLSATPAHAARFSGGLVLSIPEIAGLYASIWPSPAISIDIRATLDTIDGGVTGHIPLAGELTGRHDLLVTALGGYVHHGVESHWYQSTGPRVLGAVGYGYRSDWDFRVLAGLTGYDAERTGWAWDPTAMVYVGHFI